jgi:hypothetical protein
MARRVQLKDYVKGGCDEAVCKAIGVHNFKEGRRGSEGTASERKEKR